MIHSAYTESGSMIVFSNERSSVTDQRVDRFQKTRQDNINELQHGLTFPILQQPIIPKADSNIASLIFPSALKIISPEAQGQASAWTKSSESRRGGRPRLSNSGSSPNAMRAAGIKAVKVRTQEVPRSVLHTSESDGNDKQDTTRERNRQAASRCRNKKRRVNGDLQVQEAAINNINMYLKHEVVMLQSEILSLKNMVLQHSGCGCRLIDKYISQAARNLVQVDLNIKPSLPGEAAPLMEADVHVSELPWQNSDSEQCYVDWARLDGNSQANTPLLSSEGIVLGLMDGKCNMA